MGLVEIFHDSEGLEQRRPFAVHERRENHLRIDRAVLCLTLLALHEIDVDDLVRRKPFEVERDAHAERRKRAPK
jgi:hypothetical protein